LRHDKPEQSAQQRALPGTVRSEQPQGADFEAQADVVQRRVPPVTDDEILDLECQGRPPRCACGV
jgi:hypothetical protein